MMKRFGMCLVLAATMALAATPAAASDHVFLAYLDGTQEVPANGSLGAGFGIFILNVDEVTDALELNWAISYGGIEGGRVSGAHFHRGFFGMNGGVVKDYTGMFTLPSDTVFGAWASSDASQPLTVALANAMFGSELYFNIHSAPMYPGGEIRGQVGYYFSY